MHFVQSLFINSYLCEKFRYEKFRLWKILLSSAHWLMPHTLQIE